ASTFSAMDGFFNCLISLSPVIKADKRLNGGTDPDKSEEHKGMQIINNGKRCKSNGSEIISDGNVIADHKNRHARFGEKAWESDDTYRFDFPPFQSNFSQF